MNATIDTTTPRRRAAATLVRAAAALAFAAAVAHATAASPADPRKVVRDVFPVAETGFDPQAVHDAYSARVVDAIFETLYTYDYLARPAKLVPLTAEGMPEVADDGRTYTIRLRKGIVFAADPVFKGRRRELVADDYAFALRRLVDPAIRSPWAFLVERRIAGLDALVAEAKRTGRFDYDRPIPGIQVVDRHTLRLRLVDTDYNLPYVLAHSPTAASAREAIAAYAGPDGRASAHPVGTGPYRLARWVRSSRIVLEANPDYRGFAWSFESADPADAALVASMKGKAMPQVGRVEISVIEEDQSRLLAFDRGELDLMNLEGPLAPNVLDGDRLKPAYAQAGVQLDRSVDPEIVYTYWNMTDPVVGGLSKDRVALRRAMAMAYDPAEEVRIVRNGQAVVARYPIPQGVVGHEPGWQSLVRYDPDAANRLLDRYGYRKGRDGWRTRPDGSPLTITMYNRPDSLGRAQDELWKRSLDAIGLRVEFRGEKFPEMLKLEKQCRMPSRIASWIADWPDGDNFMQLLYGPNAFQSNNACASIPAYDALYEKSVRMPAGPERDALYRRMTRIVEAYAPWRIQVSRMRVQLLQPHVQGYRKHPILGAHWQYLDVPATRP